MRHSAKESADVKLKTYNRIEDSVLNRDSGSLRPGPGGPGAAAAGGGSGGDTGAIPPAVPVQCWWWWRRLVSIPMEAPDQAEALHRALGLTDAEADQIQELLGRPANPVELAMYSVMWSEHCSYKSSRVHLGRFPTEAPWVLVGPGENAGVIDVGDGLAVAVRIESHNHPSAIEPYQGAATGAGGIIRDIFTMGARPVALLDSLRFGPRQDETARWIAEGVVAGISGYGNSVGVPTVGGETVHDPTYLGNPLVNVMCVGVMPVDRLVLGQASGVGNLAVLLGARTGRDGIGGVSVLASAGFDESADEGAKRPSVQVGDPYEEKRLIEACLELLDSGLVVGIQDLGGAGLCCATSETASRGGVGMDVFVDAVPVREQGMAPHEIMTSESQERMLAIVEPDSLPRVRETARRWEVEAAVVGRVTPGGALRILDSSDGEVVAEVTAASLHDQAPLYHRPMAEPPDRARRLSGDPGEELDPELLAGEILAMVQDTSWVWSQYDHQLNLGTVIGPGADAALLRLRDPESGLDTGRGLGVTTDGNHRWCAVDPAEGAALTVAESVLNLACVGARPRALVNCLNFGNPEHPEVMWQLSRAVDGMAGICRLLGIPVVGGNVSLYNESNGVDIDPTPVVGLVGITGPLRVRPPGLAVSEGQILIELGSPCPEDVALGGSRWAWNRGRRDGALPILEPDRVAAVSELVVESVADGLLGAVHDVSDGGLALALVEMALAGGVGLTTQVPLSPRQLIGESPGRVVAAVDGESTVGALIDRAGDLGVAARRLGQVGGERVTLGESFDVPLDRARRAAAESRL